MDANAKKLLRQLKQYRRTAEAYEKARLKMVEKEHRGLGLTDAVVQKELKAIGVDVKSLLKDSATEAKELHKVHKNCSRSCGRRSYLAISFSKFLPIRMWLM